MKTLNKVAQKQELMQASLSQWVALAGGSVVTWSRWLNCGHDIKASSLIAPAKRLGISPGQLLDIIIERRENPPARIKCYSERYKEDS